ncbi:MAG: SMP-30/gluconolactonase/LRE family protein [Flavisolibacter sp.]|nr:SMP-30/gluconolactonase/LRE family protein [Flavisolibacter sp.]
MAQHPSLTIYDASITDFINTGFEIEKLDSTCAFSEGPVWNQEGFYLFSDIPRNVIYKLAPGTDKEVFINQSGYTSSRERSALAEQIGSNGLAYDAGHQLLICQHGNGAVAQWQGEDVKPFFSGYNGKPFNSPNDIIMHSNGTIYFSDPPYGLKDQKLQPEKYQPLAGIYCWRNGAVELFSTHYQYPNGVCLSPDERILYTCSNKPFEKFILAFDALSLQLKGTIAAENSDGIKCDRYHNLFLCSKEGIIILNKEGKRLAKIELETIPANCCWGGNGMNDLFITARQNIFLIRNLLRA